MPKIRKEIKVYESRLKEDKLNTSTKTAPQLASIGLKVSLLC